MSNKPIPEDAKRKIHEASKKYAKSHNRKEAGYYSINFKDGAEYGYCLAMEDQWISVEDKTPNNTDDVLAFMDGVVFITFYNWFDSNWGGKRYNVTHWQPLPQPPKTK